LASLSRDACGRLRARTLAYVFQEPGLLPTLDARENVAFAAWLARRAGARASAYTPQQLLELVGLGRKGAHPAAARAGGDAPRGAIARALAYAPRLLLCDEPTGQLDADTGGRVLDLLAALHAEERFALVVATHDPDVAARQERLVEIADGRVVLSEVSA